MFLGINTYGRGLGMIKTIFRNFEENEMIYISSLLAFSKIIVLFLEQQRKMVFLFKN